MSHDAPPLDECSMKENKQANVTENRSLPAHNANCQNKIVFLVAHISFSIIRYRVFDVLMLNFVILEI